MRAGSHDLRDDAPVVVRLQMEVAAPPERVWEVLTRVEEWPRWHPGAGFAVLAGELEPGTPLRWRMDGMRIASVLVEVDPPRRLAWTLRTLGGRGFQRWSLEALEDGGTRVWTEESWEGVAVSLLRRTLRRTLLLSREAWLEGLGVRVGESAR